MILMYAVKQEKLKNIQMLYVYNKHEPIFARFWVGMGL